MQIEPLLSLQGIVRDRSAGTHARWDDELYARLIAGPCGQLWHALETQPEGVRERSVLSFLTLVASGIGAGCISDGPPRTLLAGLVGNLVPWLLRTDPACHAGIVASIWNLAQGARGEALWMEQYLLARLAELDDPLCLPAQAAQLLRPALEPQPDARWQGPFEAQQIDLAQTLPDFLPGQITMVTPSLARIADRRREVSVGVLLSPWRQETPVSSAACIGRMRETQATLPPRIAHVPVSWGRDHVTAGGTRVPLPLMACEPLHTLALASGHLLAVVQSSQRLWLVQTP
jgi:hypothetical protein